MLAGSALGGRFRHLPGKVCRVLFIATVVMPLLFLGAVNILPFSVVATFGFANAALAMATHDLPARTDGIFRLTLFILIVLSAWILVQTINLPPLGQNAAWRELAAALNIQRSYISVAPADTFVAMLRVALPLVVFMTGLVLCNTDERAVRMIRTLGIIGGIVGVFALAQFILAPDMLLLEKKQFYLDSLTAVFTNRNTAAAFLGLTTLIMVTRGWEFLQNDPLVSRVAANPMRKYKDVIGIAYCLMLACVFAALMLTRSRAGVTSTFVSLLFLVPFLAYSWRSKSSVAAGGARSWRSRLIRAALVAFSLCGVLLVISVFAGRILLRAQTSGLEDSRFCVLPSIFGALSDHWAAGAGFGTFVSMFPAYRDVSCGIIGVWDRAHDFYLEGFLGLGIIFPVTLAIVIASLARILWIGLKDRKSLRHYPALGVAGTILVGLHSVLDFPLQIPGFSLYFSAFMAAIAAICLGRRGKSWNSRNSFSSR